MVTIAKPRLAPQAERALTDIARNQLAVARNGEDTGNTEYDEILVTGNAQRGAQRWKGDTVESIAEAFVATNDRATLDRIRAEYSRLRPNRNIRNLEDWQVVRDWIIVVNDLDSGKVQSCEGVYGRSPEIHQGTYLRIPEGKEIKELMWVECTKDRGAQAVPTGSFEVEGPPPIIPPTIPPANPVMSDAPLLAQFAPTPNGGPGLGISVMMYNGLFGEPPRDAAARGSHNPDRLRGGALQPGQMEGQAVRLRQRDDRTGALPPGSAGNFFMGRAQTQELVFGPETNYQLINGQWLPNPKHRQKLEENAGFAIQDGQTVETVMGGALISLARRNNPYHAGFFTDFDTSRNDIGKWNATGEAVRVITMMEGIEVQYVKIADRFTQGQSTEPAKDAERLLELNVQAALNPIVWSLSQRNAPVPTVEAFIKASEDVFNSEAFKRLPLEQQQALHDRFDPLIAKMHDPRALYAAVGGQAGVAKMYNPLDDIARDNSRTDYFQDHFEDGLGDQGRRPAGMSREDWRAQRTYNVLGMYATSIRDGEVGDNNHPPSIRPPMQVEYDVGDGAIFDTATQNPDAVRTGRRQALGLMTTDDTLLDNIITFTVNTPGALEKWTKPVFDASRRHPADNRRILNFGSDREADRFAEDVGAKLFGEQFKEIDYQGQNIFNSIINMGTLGLATPGANRNQNKGLFAMVDKDGDGIKETRVDLLAVLRDRWENGTDEDRRQIREAFRAIADRAGQAQDNGVGIAAASIMMGLTPKLDQMHNGGYESDLYAGIRQRIPVVTDAYALQLNATENAAAEVRIGTAQRVQRGDNIASISDDTALAASRDGRDRIQIQGAPGSQRVNYQGATTFDMTGVRGGGIAALTRGEPGKVSQSDMNSEVVLMSADASKMGFSLTLLHGVATGAVDPNALLPYLHTVDRGTGDASQYADLMTHYVKAIAAARGNPQAILALENEAAGKLTGFFAEPDSRFAGSRTAAVQFLAKHVSNDESLSAGFATSLRSLVNATGLDTNGAAYQSLNAGANPRDMNAFNVQIAQLAALRANNSTNPAELEASMSASMGQLNATPGISWRWTAMLLGTFLIPPGTIPRIPGLDCPGCIPTPPIPFPPAPGLPIPVPPFGI